MTPTNDAFHEADETISIEGELGSLTVTHTSIKLTSEDAAAAITLSVDADTGADGIQDSLAEAGGPKTVRVTATLDGTTRFATAQAVTVKVGKTGDTATEGADYTNVPDRTITIPANTASASVTFTLTPANDTRLEADETISIDGELAGVTVTGTTIKLTSEDTAPTTLALTLDADTGADNVQDSIAEDGSAKTVRVDGNAGRDDAVRR